MKRFLCSVICPLPPLRRVWLHHSSSVISLTKSKAGSKSSKDFQILLSRLWHNISNRRKNNPNCSIIFLISINTICSFLWHLLKYTSRPVHWRDGWSWSGVKNFCCSLFSLWHRAESSLKQGTELTDNVLTWHCSSRADPRPTFLNLWCQNAFLFTWQRGEKNPMVISPRWRRCSTSVMIWSC